MIEKALGKLDFLAATDHFMTPTTALADIVEAGGILSGA